MTTHELNRNHSQRALIPLLVTHLMAIGIGVILHSSFSPFSTRMTDDNGRIKLSPSDDETFSLLDANQFHSRLADAATKCFLELEYLGPLSRTDERITDLGGSYDFRWLLQRRRVDIPTPNEQVQWSGHRVDVWFSICLRPEFSKFPTPIVGSFEHKARKWNIHLLSQSVGDSSDERFLPNGESVCEFFARFIAQYYADG